MSPDASISFDPADPITSPSKLGRPRLPPPPPQAAAPEPTRPVTMDPASVTRPMGRQSARNGGRRRDNAKSAPDSHHAGTSKPPAALSVAEVTESLESYDSVIDSLSAALHEELFSSAASCNPASRDAPPVRAGRRASPGEAGSSDARGSIGSRGGASPTASFGMAPKPGYEAASSAAYPPHPDWVVRSNNSGGTCNGTSRGEGGRGAGGVGFVGAVGGDGPPGRSRGTAAGSGGGGTSGAAAALRMLEVEQPASRARPSPPFAMHSSVPRTPHDLPSTTSLYREPSTNLPPTFPLYRDSHTGALREALSSQPAT